MRSRDIRRGFLEYFQRHGHTIVPSSSLVPDDDPTLLFTNAGMNQFKDAVPRPREARLHPRHHLAEVHAGQRQAQRPRQRRPVAAPSHLLRDARQLLVRRLLQARGDSVRVGAADEGVEPAGGPAVSRPSSRATPAFRATTRRTRSGRGSCPASRITELGLAENFWQMGDTGPCGRCSEIHYYRGGDIPCERGAGGGRASASTAAAIATSRSGTTCSWSSTASATARSIRCRRRRSTPGMGLERITAVIQGKLSNYDTDLFTPILDAIGERAGRPTARRSDDPGRRLDARDRRSPARDDLPHRRRRACRRTSGAATCCARSCGARCGTARSSASPSRCSTRWCRCWSARWATPIRSSIADRTTSCGSSAARKSASTRC